MGDLFVILDIVTLAAGLGLIIVPNMVWNLGRKEGEKEVLEGRKLLFARIFGAVVAAASAFFLYAELSGRM